MDRPGNIILQLLRAIGRCRYGICYFSEPGEDGQFFDNLNVIFEAGMFHGKLSTLGGSSSTWIPIRETESPRIFFDLDQERILKVDRKPDGKLDEDAFTKKLSTRIEAMLLPDEN